MIVISRHRDQVIRVGDVDIKVLKIDGNRVKFGVESDQSIPVARGELPVRLLGVDDTRKRLRLEGAA